VPEAPHGNPLDPDHFSSVNSSSIIGSVFTLYSPRTQLPGVTIFVKEAGRSVQTNNTGDFQIDNLNPGKYTIFASKENYQTDSIVVNLQTKTNFETEPFHLNAIPQLKDIKYFSEVSYSFLSDPIIRVIADISVIDFDGAQDIDSVYAWIPDYSFKMIIDTTEINDLVIEQTDSLGFNLFKLSDKPLFLVVKDKSGFTTTAGPFFVHQFIINTPQPKAPIDLDVAIQPLLFTWDKVEPPYSFTYEINLVRRTANGGQEVLPRITGIGPDETSFSFNQILDSGVYFWQVAIRDSKNNLGQSAQAVFQIQ